MDRFSFTKIPYFCMQKKKSQPTMVYLSKIHGYSRTFRPYFDFAEVTPSRQKKE